MVWDMTPSAARAEVSEDRLIPEVVRKRRKGWTCGA